MRIVIAGAGVVGLTNALFLSKNHEITLIEKDKGKREVFKENKFNYIKSIIPELNKPQYFRTIVNDFNIDNIKLADSSIGEEFVNSDCLLIAVNTDIDPFYFKLNIDEVEKLCLLYRDVQPNKPIIIRSTMPIGGTESINAKSLIYVPEFIEEHNPIATSLNKKNIVIGTDSPFLFDFCKDLFNKDSKMINIKEAEASKLFINSYLAMRVSFFNTVSNLGLINNLNTEEMINVISSDPRIGSYYNRTSIGFEGSCLPKDIKSLSKQLENSLIDSGLFKSTINDNRRRSKILKEYIEKKCINRTIGIYRLSSNDKVNRLDSQYMTDLANQLSESEYIKVIVFEPQFDTSGLNRTIPVYKEFDDFIENIDFIITNTYPTKYVDKVYGKSVISFDRI